jgi:hypothetical protein
LPKTLLSLACNETPEPVTVTGLPKYEISSPTPGLNWLKSYVIPELKLVGLKNVDTPAAWDAVAASASPTKSAFAADFACMGAENITASFSVVDHKGWKPKLPITQAKSVHKNLVVQIQ